MNEVLDSCVLRDYPIWLGHIDCSLNYGANEGDWLRVGQGQLVYPSHQAKHSLHWCVEIKCVDFKPFNIYVNNLEFPILFTKINIKMNLGCTNEPSPRKKTTINIGKKNMEKNMDQIKL